MQNLAIFGIGYVGLVTAACFSDIGHNVVCVDENLKKVNMLLNGICPIYEEGLEEMIHENHDRLHFTNDSERAVREADIVFIAVGTPQAPDGRADLSAVKAAAVQIARCMEKDGMIVVVKSTVPVGTNKMVKELILANQKKPYRFTTASCPEFLREGTAIRDVFEADRFVIGAEDGGTQERMAKVYKRFGRKIVFTDIASAEMTKYAANAFLATKISFINEIANICEHFDANIDHVVKGIGSDQRIGDRFLRAGIGFGGSCFPKDTHALLRMAEDAGNEFSVLHQVVQANARQVTLFLDKIGKHYAGRLEGKTVAVWGLSYKPGTDDVRDSPSLRIVSELLDSGCVLKVYDPVAMDNFRSAVSHENLQNVMSASEAASGADMLLILTEWDEFVKFPLDRINSLLRGKVVFDGRNCFSRSSAIAHGLTYYSIGRSSCSKNPGSVRIIPDHKV